MIDLYQTGDLNLEAFEEARKAFRQRILPDGSPLQLGQRIDVLPSPRKEGETIFGMSLKEYRATCIDGILQWQATGKTWLNYYEPVL